MFKPWDKVRLNRTWVKERTWYCDDVYEELINSAIVAEAKDHLISLQTDPNIFYPEDSFELCPTEGFTLGEIVEVKQDVQTKWVQMKFVTEIIKGGERKFLCISTEKVLRKYTVGFSLWENIRKYKPRITRTEISKRLDINRDFELVDE